jgi:hypothetical protein
LLVAPGFAQAWTAEAAVTTRVLLILRMGNIAFFIYPEKLSDGC